MKRTWKKLFAFVCAFTLVAAPVTYNTVNADAPGLNSNGVQIGNVSIGNNSTTSSNNASVGTDYTLTIPATLNVSNAGWNATDGISATGTLATGKKLVVTASSDGEFALVSGENKVNYKLAESGGTNTTYANATEKTSWEFTSLSETAATQLMGIVVEDYSSKPAGDYSDTVTFTASVEDAAYVPKTFTSLSDGDILRVGDTLDFASGRYDFRNDSCSLLASNAPFTVLRANVEGIGDLTIMPSVTEDVNGAYYVIKDKNNRYYDFKGRLAATDTSDGVIITTKNDSDLGSYWAINVHEP